jgi:hypothetical protein
MEERRRGERGKRRSEREGAEFLEAVRNCSRTPCSCERVTQEKERSLPVDLIKELPNNLWLVSVAEVGDEYVEVAVFLEES